MQHQLRENGQEQELTGDQVDALLEEGLIYACDEQECVSEGLTVYHIGVDRDWSDIVDHTLKG